MPIGKNAIKRVENNGYSNVKSKAPDMENSTVIAVPDKQVEEKILAPIAEKTAKKTCAKKTCATAKKPATKAVAPKAEEVKEAPVEKKSTAKKPVQKKPAVKKVDKVATVKVGDDMPYFLL